MTVRAKLNTLLVIALLLVLSSISFPYDWKDASATQCVRHSPEIYYERSDIIFVASVIDIDYEPSFLEHGQYVLLNVSKSWKGIGTKAVTVNAEGGRFREGNEFLVYAEKNFLAIEVTFCGGTIQTDSGDFVDRELAYLNSHPILVLKEGHTMSKNPFPLLALIGSVAGMAFAAVGILKSGITVGMLKNAVPVFAGLILGVFFIWLFSNITFPANMVCHAKPLEQIEKLSPILVMVPTVLPEGYSYQGGEIVMGKGVFSLQYFNEPVCGGSYVRSVSDGVILVSGSPIEFERIPHNMTSADYLDYLFLQSKERLWDTEKRYSFPDGREALAITENIASEYNNTYVYIADGSTKTWYTVASSRSVEEAVRIAESLRER